MANKLVWSDLPSYHLFLSVVLPFLLREQDSFFFGFFYILLPNSSFRLCLSLSQQPWILIWQMLACNLTVHLGLQMTGRSSISWTHTFQKLYTHVHIAALLYLDDCTSKWVGGKDLFIFSVAFVATQNILNFFSGTFQRMKASVSGQKLMICNVLCWLFLWSLP